MSKKGGKPDKPKAYKPRLIMLVLQYEATAEQLSPIEELATISGPAGVNAVELSRLIGMVPAVNMLEQWNGTQKTRQLIYAYETKVAWVYRLTLNEPNEANEMLLQTLVIQAMGGQPKSD